MQRRAGASAVSARRNAYAPQAEGEPRSTCSRPTSSGDVSARADESAMLLATFFGKRTRANFARRLQIWSTRANYFRETPDRQPRPPLRGARAWGRRRVLPARTVTLSRRAPSSVSATGVRAARVQGFATFGDATFGPKTGRFLTRRAESATMSSMTNTRSERVDAEAMTPPSSTRRPGVAGESFGDVSPARRAHPRPGPGHLRGRIVEERLAAGAVSMRRERAASSR